jgi:alpha-L-fucosidase 2
MKTLRLLCGLLLLACAGCKAGQNEQVQQLALFFEQPAILWEERLPLGNGRLGAMADGGIATEHIILNESSLWSGSPAADNKENAHRILPLLRELLYKEQVEKAQELMYGFFTARTMGSEGSMGAATTFGSYQLLGSAVFDFIYHTPSREKTEYNRLLDLSTAVSFTSFTLNDITYTRELFTSFSDDVVILYLTSSQPRTLHFKAALNRPEKAVVYTRSNTLVMEGTLSSGQEGVEGMSHYTRLDILPLDEGTVTANDTALYVKGATRALAVLSAGTNFDPETLSVRADSAYIKKTDSLALQALHTSFADLKKRHVDTYQSFFHRVQLQLPDESALYFQMGRYLLIASARPGCLPPNLQGLWTPSLQTPWNGAYDLNMHLQMNFWPALKTNLAELHVPLLDFTERLAEKGKETAQAYYDAPGWAAHARTNPWGFTAPGHNTAWGGYNAAGAWLCAHIWNHYAYTKDLERLRRDYPVMKEAALFYLSTLMEEPHSECNVPAPSMSYGNTYYLPETSAAPLFLCMGSTSDVQALKELFTNVIAANKILLNTDNFPLMHRLEEALERLPAYKTNALGCLLRWQHAYQEEDVRLRNIPHLYALYPGTEFTENTPDMLTACHRTLERQGGASTAWQMAWNVNLYARLGDGESAYKTLQELRSPALEESISPYPARDTASVTLLTPGTYPNGFSSNPHFQLAGNLGGCAGIAEMLLQCHQGFIHVLPALPAAWQEKGSFSGLCVRGGGEVSCSWEQGLVKEIVLKAQTDHTFTIKIPPHFRDVKKEYLTVALKKGEYIKIHERSIL